MGKNKAVNTEKFRLSKTERLHSKKLIDKLFKDGETILAHPVKCLYRISDETLSSPIQVMISVPKRNFGKAVDRNLIKRRIREAYRLNKNSLIHIGKNKSLLLALLYIHKEVGDYNSIEYSVQKIIKDLVRKLSGK